MLSKIRKTDTEKLKKYLLINDQCFTCTLVALVAVLMILGIPSIVKFIDGIVTDIVIPIGAFIFLLIVSAIFDGISKQITQELSRRKEQETIEILSVFGAKKIKLNDFGNIDFEELFEDAEMEAEYDDENDVIYVRIIITDDESCTKISKRIKFEKDDIVSAIEII